MTGKHLSGEVCATVLASALEQIADSVMITDVKGTITYVNDSFERLTGYSRDEALGRRPSLLKSGRHSDAFYQRLWSNLRSDQPFRAEFINRRKDGTIYHEAKTITPIRGYRGDISHYVATGRDVSGRIIMEERLRRLANTDELTGLANRSRFIDLLHKGLRRLRVFDEQLAVLFIDLDDFKAINDTYGHQAGDRLLVDVARRIESALYVDDVLARIGGDEFALLLRDSRSVTAVRTVCEKIMSALESPFKVATTCTRVAASIGVSRSPVDGQDPSTLLKKADAAMYVAKKKGGTYRLFESSMVREPDDQRRMRNDLRRAETESEFFLDYQPQVDLASGSIRSVEALLRWRHPSHGVMGPATFLPLLEETGMIHSVGRWIFRQACTQLASWQAAGLGIPMVSINVSATQLEDPHLGHDIASVIAEQGLSPGAVEIELVETARLADIELVESTLRALDASGVRLALDDFGTGFSALTHLHRFPVQTIKIDRDFVRAMDGETGDIRLVESIIGVARMHALDVVAEGLETAEQCDLLRGLECDFGQGFIICRPGEPRTVANFARTHERWPPGTPCRLMPNEQSRSCGTSFK